MWPWRVKMPSQNFLRLLLLLMLVMRIQSSYLSKISRFITVEKNQSCGEISDFCKEFVQFMEFDRIYAVFVLNLCGEKMTNMRSVRIVLATVCCRFVSWGLVIKLIFIQTLSLVKILNWSQARFWSWSLVIILPLILCRSYEIQKLGFGQYFEL